ncbi:elongation factor Ts-like protein [Volvox carteri f. nagariensis]|uniref:Elongation factor Ts, mitochondrial n=1 Tax=Volvox carteri f. nagariensis TaxID=3068 RepID=D8THC1_VOLCA|nr:elongation factor Ts-like protein [Volvox carteri f. nagariensis]EFJ52684.1 elongation factor Ts-like protein [Volvox carteri f. nagariensis]|eukprot:XP_002945689.1 elongation factor Ts-like protein [Volvox carteri f. nagariensis]
MLLEHGWDVDKAYEALRRKGLAAAAKKASRHAAEGLVGASFAAAAASTTAAATNRCGGAGSVVMVELNSETDFVARNALFQDLMRDVLTAAHSLGRAAAVGPDHSIDLQQLLSVRTASGSTVSEAVTQVAAQVRENVRLRRAYRLDSGDGLVYQYVHQSSVPGLGKLAAAVVLRSADGSSLVDLSSTSDSSSSSSSAASLVQAAGEGLAMQVAGMRPAYLTRGSVPAEVLAQEQELLLQQMQQDEAFRGKPPQVLSKVVQGRLSKKLSEMCLAEQTYVLDDSITVEKMMARLRKDVGRPQLQVSAFLRVQCGEGLGTKSGDNFATEVARIVSET